MPAGRPTKYRPEYCEQMIKWFDLKRIEGRPAWFFDFAREIDVNDDTLTEWTKKHEEFSVAYKMCERLQMANLADGGITGRYNAQMAFNSLKNVSNWRDKTEQMVEMTFPQKIEIEFIPTKKDSNNG